MFCVGLTGNIASGKSSVIKIFQSLNINIINADQIAREITQPNQPGYYAIKDHFGIEVFSSDGELNRTALRQTIFKSPEQRVWLENLLHPMIRKIIKERIDKLSSSPYCVIEIPLLKRREEYPYLNRILVLLADPKIQIERVMQRDNCDQAHAQAIIAAQPSEEHRKQIADDIVINNGSIEELSKKINNLHIQYLQYAGLHNSKKSSLGGAKRNPGSSE